LRRCARRSWACSRSGEHAASSCERAARGGGRGQWRWWRGGGCAGCVEAARALARLEAAALSLSRARRRGLTQHRASRSAAPLHSPTQLRAGL
jgi:hypothetical protein